jgi:hypothetical protein
MNINGCIWSIADDVVPQRDKMSIAPLGRPVVPDV